MNQRKSTMSRQRKSALSSRGPTVAGLRHVLQKTPRTSITFTELHRRVRIYYKKSFLTYLHYCLAHKFVRKGIPPYTVGRAVDHVYYTRTDLGDQFLNLTEDP